MPIYEYRCQECGHYVDVLQKVSDAPLKECPECENPEGLKRLISAPAFRLKGGGWYETDFKSDKEKRRNLADRPDGGEGKSSAESASGDAKSGESSKSSESSGKSSESTKSSSDKSSSDKSSGGGSQSKAAV